MTTNLPKSSNGTLISHKEAGARWVRLRASKKELQRLAEYAEMEDAFDSQPHDAFSSAEAMAIYVSGDQCSAVWRQSALDFWINEGYDRVPSGVTASEFALGALEATRK